MNENVTTHAVKTASELLYKTGLMARSDEEVELLNWFRKLPPIGQQLELARASGMVQAIEYGRKTAQEQERQNDNTNKL